VFNFIEMRSQIELIIRNACLNILSDLSLRKEEYGFTLVRGLLRRISLLEE